MRVLLGPLAMLAALIAAASSAACGSVEDARDDAPAGGAGGVAVTVVMDEWSVEPAVASAPAGEVTFNAVNRGGLAHDLWVIRTDLDAGALDVESGFAVVADGEVAARSGDVTAGAAERLTATLEAGRYVLICNIAGHYELGMRVSFAVR